MKKSNSLTLEHGLYLAVGLLALALRFYRLDAAPLTDAEAAEALKIWAFAQGAPVVAGAVSPAYFFLGYLSMWPLGAGEATARAAAALVGSTLVFVPAFFRAQLGRGGALLAALFLAISASGLGASRLVDGNILGITALAWGLVCIAQFQRTGAWGWLAGVGVAAGFGLTSGPQSLLAGLALVVTWLVMRWLTPAVTEIVEVAAEPDWQGQWMGWAVPLGLTIFIVATVAFLRPLGLSDVPASWAAGLAGFVAPNALNPGLLAFFLVGYEPLALVLGIYGVARAFSGGVRWAQALGWFTLLMLFLEIIYGGRAFVMLVWVAVPLSVLAGWAVALTLSELWEREQWPLAAVQFGVAVGLMMFVGLNFTSYALAVQDGRGELVSQVGLLQIPAWAQLIVSVVGLLLIGAVGALLAVGWGERPALFGSALFVAVALGAMTFSAAWGLTQFRVGVATELWVAQPTHGDLYRLVKTLTNTSNYTEGTDYDIPVTVLAGPGQTLTANGAVVWALRAFPNLQVVDRLDPTLNSPVVITLADIKDPTLGSAYVGQDFILHTQWQPQLSWTQWLAWAALRYAPGQQTERVILWVRQDVQRLEQQIVK